MLHFPDIPASELLAGADPILETIQESLRGAIRLRDEDAVNDLIAARKELLEYREFATRTARMN